MASLIAASGLLAAAAPGGAGGNHGTTQARAGASGAESALADDPDRRICIHVAFTGSRVVRRVCKTARAWEAEGGVPPGER